MMNEKKEYEKQWESKGDFLIEYSIKYGKYFIKASEKGIDDLTYTLEMIKDKKASKGVFYKNFSGKDDRNNKVLIQIYTDKLITVINEKMMFVYKNIDE